MPLSRIELRPACVLVALFALTGCSSQAPLSRVTLLPDPQGRSTSVVVSAQGSQVLSQAYQVAQVDKQGSVKVGVSSPEMVSKTYPSLVTGLPAEPKVFLLMFQPGTSTLTIESAALLPAVINAAKLRLGGEIIVTGHTDRLGSAQANDALSLQRAQAIRSLLVEQGFDGALIESRGRGERDPVIPTDDEVAEPRNRRAELMVR